MDSTADGSRAVAAAAAACATAQMPNSFATGIDRARVGSSAFRHARSASRSLRGVAARVRASCTSVGQTSATSHTSFSRPATKA
eukprot:6028671-Pleurochrysis_carterae.AAC.1